MRAKARKLLKYWLPVALWMLLIFTASTDLMSAEHTSRFLVPFLRWLRPGISPESLAYAQFLMRKLAHVTEYAVLAGLLARAVFHASPFGRTALGAAALVFSACAAFACSDEYHQSFVATRTASTRDVAIDCAGTAAGIIVWTLFRRRKNQKWA